MIGKKFKKNKWLTLPVCFILLLLLFPLVSAASTRIWGVVVDEEGEPVKNAVITAEYWMNPLVKQEGRFKSLRRSERRYIDIEYITSTDPAFSDTSGAQPVPKTELPQARRETHSDDLGKFSINFVRKGNWRITAYTDERMSLPLRLNVQADTPEIKLKVTITSTGILFEVKRFIYRRDFRKAIDSLSWFKHRFSRSKNLENASYWLAYCRYKLSEDMVDEKEKKKIDIEAIKDLDELIEHFPAGEWADDAKILRIEFAQKLVRLGEGKYKKYIIDALRPVKKTESDIEIAALAALITIDKKTAIARLIDIIKKEKDSEVRKKAIFILATNKIEVAIPVIQKAAEKDHDESVRSAAALWLNYLKTTIRR